MLLVVSVNLHIYSHPPRPKPMRSVVDAPGAARSQPTPTPAPSAPLEFITQWTDRASGQWERNLSLAKRFAYVRWHELRRDNNATKAWYGAACNCSAPSAACAACVRRAAPPPFARHVWHPPRADAPLLLATRASVCATMPVTIF